MSNALSEEKRQQVIALGRLGWPLRRIEEETGVRRETWFRQLDLAPFDLFIWPHRRELPLTWSAR